MNEKDFIQALAKQFFLTKVESKKILEFFILKITEGLQKNKRVYLRGFGSFTKEKRVPKKVRHPLTGKIITIPERLTVDFKPSLLFLKNIG